MYAVVVSIAVKPEHVAAFKAAILDNAAGSRKEPGNIRYDVIQHEDEPTRFSLFEVYKTKADFVAHQQTPHYLRWRDTTVDHMAGPRSAAKGTPLFFGDKLV